MKLGQNKGLENMNNYGNKYRNYNNILKVVSIFYFVKAEQHMHIVMH